mmetsp:Transcript_7160/g.15290  ORF Transcript_7160/g.15290 Transcript_7160/m.15290 type:complete len:100 (-) Transcript_7160:374-673(-)
MILQQMIVTVAATAKTKTTVTGKVHRSHQRPKTKRRAAAVAEGLGRVGLGCLRGLAIQTFLLPSGASVIGGRRSSHLPEQKKTEVIQHPSSENKKQYIP